MSRPVVNKIAKQKDTITSMRHTTSRQGGWGQSDSTMSMGRTSGARMIILILAGTAGWWYMRVAKHLHSVTLLLPRWFKVYLSEPKSFFLTRPPAPVQCHRKGGRSAMTGQPRCSLTKAAFDSRCHCTYYHEHRCADVLMLML